LDECGLLGEGYGDQWFFAVLHVAAAFRQRTARHQNASDCCERDQFGTHDNFLPAKK
jgi:hypothetical protein